MTRRPYGVWQPGDDENEGVGVSLQDGEDDTWASRVLTGAEATELRDMLNAALGNLAPNTEETE